MSAKARTSKRKRRTPVPSATIVTSAAFRQSISGLPLTWKLQGLLLKLKAAERCIHGLAEGVMLTAFRAHQSVPEVAAGWEVLRDSIRDLEYLERITSESEVLGD